MNQFDFYTVYAIADRVGDLVRAGVDRARCSKYRTGKYRVVGKATYPITRWEATIGFVDVADPDCRTKLAALEAKHKGDGVRIHSHYVTRD